MKNKLKRALAIVLTISIVMSLAAVSMLFETAATPTSIKVVQATTGDEDFVFDYTELNWNSEEFGYGQNLVVDPKVECFDYNGTGDYLNYYASNRTTVENENAWWANPLDKSQEFVLNNKNQLQSPKKRGFITSDTAKSHTNDGSGAIEYTLSDSKPDIYLRLPRMEAGAYFCVTFWMYMPSDYVGGGVKIFTDVKDENAKATLTTGYKTGWNRITFIVYTHTSALETAFIAFNAKKDTRFDDFAVYKLSDTYGETCMERGCLTELPRVPSKKFSAKQVMYDTTNANAKYDYNEYDWDLLNTLYPNLVPDSNLALFDSQGNYAQYFDTDEETVINPDAFWDKPVNLGQHLNRKGFGDGWGDSVYSGPDYNGQTCSDMTKSYIQDGSGCLYEEKEGENLRFSLPKLEAYNFYVVTFFVKLPSDDLWSDSIRFYSGLNENRTSFSPAYVGKHWQRIIYLVYTGEKDYSEPFCEIYTWADTRVDNIAVHKLDYEYGLSCQDAGYLLEVPGPPEESKAITTPNIDDFDYDNADNIYQDGSFETSSEAVNLGANAKFGSYALEVTSDKDIALPALDTNRYYFVSYWSKVVGAGAGEAADISLVQTFDNTASASAKASSGDWTQTTFFINTKDRTDYVLRALRGTLSSGAKLYIDGVSIVKAEDTVKDAVRALDTYPEVGFYTDRLELAEPFFATASKYSDLVSPIKSTDGNPVTYTELYTKYFDAYSEYDRRSRGFAPSGYGNRCDFPGYYTNPETNAVLNPDVSDETYWSDATGYGTYAAISTDVAYDGNTSLKISGAGEYIKRITNLKPNQTYYLQIRGYGNGDPAISDVQFGFYDTTYGLRLENPIDDHVRTHNCGGAHGQVITFQCQDGTWYQRGYKFYTGKNTELDFFIKSSVGTVYFDDINVFAAEDSYQVVKGQKQNVSTTEFDEKAFYCEDSNNMFTNGKFDKGTEFWGNYEGINSMVEVATSEGNKMLHFKSSDMDYYYMAWIDIEPNVEYIFSYWSMTLNGEGSKFGIISESNPRGYISSVNEVNMDYGQWKLSSIRFSTENEDRVALAVFDNGGEAVFDNVRLFKSSNGIVKDAATDKPVGGLTFTDSKLGSDGLQEKDVPEEPTTPTTPEEPTIENLDKDDDDGETTEEVIKKIIRKRKKKNAAANEGLPVVAIVLICVGAVLLVAGVTTLIIILVKRKKRKSDI